MVSKDGNANMYESMLCRRQLCLLGAAQNINEVEVEISRSRRRTDNDNDNDQRRRVRADSMHAV
jgi:hypothetical protein